jgi:hypothetical protein
VRPGSTARGLWRRPGTASIISVCTVLLLGGAVLAASHRVDNSITPEDRQYIARFLAGVPPLRSEPPTYADQIDFVTRAQQAVLRLAPLDEGLPANSPREPKEVFEAHRGLCYDRSRVIEKILRYSGLTTRHVALYAVPEAGSALGALLTPGSPSHATTEVLTPEGWLVVDSNAPWLSLDRSGRPVSIAAMQAAASGSAQIAWRTPPPNGLYVHPFTFVYGLYSRNGRFYPPYDSIPDVQYGELMDNVYDPSPAAAVEN